MYPGWEEEIFQLDGKDILLANFYVICNKAPVPKCLQCKDWDTRRYMYAIARSGEENILKFYGTISSAYRFYNIADFTVKGNEKYKLSDK